MKKMDAIVIPRDFPTMKITVLSNPLIVLPTTLEVLITLYPSSILLYNHSLHLPCKRIGAHCCDTYPDSTVNNDMNTGCESMLQVLSILFY